jgi:hypothetical protein
VKRVSIATRDELLGCADDAIRSGKAGTTRDTVGQGRNDPQASQGSLSALVRFGGG